MEPEHGPIAGPTEDDPGRPAQPLALDNGLSDRPVDLSPIGQPELADLRRADARPVGNFLENP
jgi:hypothetical protein